MYLEKPSTESTIKRVRIYRNYVCAHLIMGIIDMWGDSLAGISFLLHRNQNINALLSRTLKSVVLKMTYVYRDNCI